MTGKPPRLRDRAAADIEAIARHYHAEAGPTVALAFADALEAALRQVSAHPGSGSTRHAEPAAIPGLRFWPLRRFPQLVFYLEAADHIDVVRVLHGRRDIPASLQDTEQEREESG